MYGRTRYVIIGLVVILVFLLGLVLLRAGRSNNDQAGSPDTTADTAPPKQISDYNTPSSMVRLTMDGSVNADQTHRMIRITISQNQTNLDVFQGYQYNLLNSKTYSNNKDAYNDFLFGLRNADFDKNRNTKQTNYAGMCQLGIRYIYEIFDQNKQVSSRWSASCGSMGTFGGKTGLVNTLFKAQIPDYPALTKGVEL